MKVLHVLETSFPDTGGYVIRAAATLGYQRKMGLTPVAVTSPLLESKQPLPRVQELDGVRYYRTNYIPSPRSTSSKLGSYFNRIAMLRRYRKAVMQIVEQESPDVIHAHSSYSNAYAALPAARRFNLPLVYEVRNLWGESAIVESGMKTTSWKYRLLWRMELGAMRNADAVVPISAGIQRALAARGIDERKMTIVPNGVDSTQFVPRHRDDDLAHRHGLDGKFVIGFIGSIRKLEGLATLVEAYARLRNERDDVRLVIVGDGPERAEVQRFAGSLPGCDALFTGHVPHQDVGSWYSVIDVLVYPRIRATVTESVTPLKPLEAMALGKVCIGSDVGGLTELIRDDNTGVVFSAGDAGALAAAIAGLLNDPPRIARLGAAAIRFARTERDWSAIVPKTLELYERLIEAKRADARALKHA